MGWEEAYEHKIALWKFWNSIGGRTFGTYFGESMARKNPHMDNQDPYLSRVHSVEATKLMLADPIWVDPDMMDIWEAAVQVPEDRSFQPEPLLHEDLLVHQGFVYLPRPMYTIDSNGLKIAYRAIAWSVMGLPDDDGRYNGIALSIYSHRHDKDDYSGVEEIGEDLVRGLDLRLAHVTPWPFGESFDRLVPNVSVGDSNYAPDAARKAWSGLWIEIQALFRLMNQRISVVSETQAPRATRRRAKHAGLDDESLVKLVKLRRAKSKASEDTREVEWKNRWLVDGHWRDQWYPSLNVHRQIWISSYVKGPEDKELKVKPIKAYTLVR